MAPTMVGGMEGLVVMPGSSVQFESFGESAIVGASGFLLHGAELGNVLSRWRWTARGRVHSRGRAVVLAKSGEVLFAE